MTPAHTTPIITDDLPALRADLTSAHYTVDGTTQALGELASNALHREQAVPAQRALANQTSACAYLIKLFILGEEITDHQATTAFPTLTIQGALNLNIIEPTPHGYRATAEIRPHALTDEDGQTDWWLASDLTELATGTTLNADHVLGAGGASLTLAHITARTPTQRVLDLGTGCGIQAIHASRHATHITATDISERALNYARFNAALNNITIDLRHGSLLEPVANEKFDLVVSNPPFVITPRTTHDDHMPQYEYRDAGHAGDNLIHELIANIATVLAPGGSVYMLGNWEIHNNEPWTTRINEWLNEAEHAHGPLDAWIIQRELLDPAQYAETWIRDGGTTPDRNPAEYAAAYNAWLDDFDTRNVTGIGFGMIYLRKPANGKHTLRRLEEITGTIQQPLGPVYAQALAAHDWHTALDDQQLAQQRLHCTPDVTDERYYTPGEENPNVIIIRQGSGFSRAIQASTPLAGLISASDGELSVGQIIGALATLLSVDHTELFDELLPDIRGLITDGILKREN
ncbi:DUF7059 domain-containing protein [Timonella sp. A28]|uniref:DUF7059 domain-containing protein n=1 Tax=Timonella sp. A28 TaxID=3442640 RepID=UPI003EBF8E8D